jgi:hypothetical protein
VPQGSGRSVVSSGTKGLPHGVVQVADKDDFQVYMRHIQRQ